MLVDEQHLVALLEQNVNVQRLADIAHGLGTEGLVQHRLLRHGLRRRFQGGNVLFDRRFRRGDGRARRAHGRNVRRIGAHRYGDRRGRDRFRRGGGSGAVGRAVAHAGCTRRTGGRGGVCLPERARVHRAEEVLARRARGGRAGRAGEETGAALFASGAKGAFDIVCGALFWPSAASVP